LTILILSSPEDLHAQFVARHLTDVGAQFAYFNLGDLFNNSEVSFSIDDRGWKCAVVSPSIDSRINLEDCQSVWLRRPGKVKAPPMPDEWMEALIEWESRRALEAIFRLMPARWINAPAQQYESRLKTAQLERARLIGFQIPETTITSVPDVARAFYEQHQSKVIYKLIDEETSRLFPAFAGTRGIPTLPVRKQDSEFFDQVQYGLHLFQRRIDKIVDVRVTVVGSQIFAVEIHSQEGEGQLDFRLDYSVPMKVHRLPDDIAEKCLSLTKTMGLVFGAIDLALDKEGRYHFFELNPAGQFLWMETALNLPISKAIAQLLI
jgi:glutathione synthase/RimK-type ligase-like ATP-grasp enzyme